MRTSPKPTRRRPGLKTLAVAAVVAVGALTAASSASAQMDVNLTVSNRSPDQVDVVMCTGSSQVTDNQNCGSEQLLLAGESISTTGPEPLGIIKYRSWSAGGSGKVYFAGKNPLVGPPGIWLSGERMWQSGLAISPQGNGEWWALDQGEIRSVGSSGRYFKVSRGGDSDTKMLVLEIF